jgi:hypothetical protein
MSETHTHWSDFVNAVRHSVAQLDSSSTAHHDRNSLWRWRWQPSRPAAPAHADQQSYLADLSAAGAPMPQGPDRALSAGYQVCAAVRGGIPPNIAATNFGWMAAWGPAYVSAAQRDLCPDTLKH